MPPMSAPAPCPGAPIASAMRRGPAPGLRPIRRILRALAGGSVLAALALLAACERQPSPEAQRMDELNLKIQQLEQRINTLSRQHDDAADRKGKPPVGVIKSLTIRTGTEDDRLRIYWADGSTTDLPCTKEQNTFACG